MVAAERSNADVCIIGAGPAGSTLAARLAALGHDVCIVERSAFPRGHLGESLSPGVLPLLEMIGAREPVEAAGFWPVRSVLMKWDQGLRERRDSGPQGLLVERGRFDTLLLERAKALGVRTLQPAAIRERWRDETGWTVRIEAQGRTVDLRVALLADASGRSAALARRRRTGVRTLALYAYWRGRKLPDRPHIEAGTEAWYWGVPLPDGTYNTLAFVDVEQFRGGDPAPLARRFLELIDRSELMAGCRDARLASRVLAADATPYIDEQSVTPLSIKVGEAALALDPLSSSGVQKAMQTALAGAVVVNTLLRRPESSDAALRFYRDNLADASERHRRWAAAHYGAVAMRNGGKFWQDRAASAQSHPQPQPASPGAARQHSLPEALVELSPQLEFVDLPCIDGEFVAVKPALRHPGLDSPVAYLGNWELAPLLQQLPAGMTPLQIARSWSSRIPLSAGLAIVAWLLGNGILVEQAVRRTTERV